ncbi:MAG: BrnA antitoxin family protein [Pyrinomonadaceae bacterium]|nr:BrnA antitoxin family protein [Pyrinomonadaceae bacterium]
MSNTKNKDYEYLETSEEASKRGLKRITRPAFLGEPKNVRESKSRITIYLDADIVEHFKTEAENSKIGYQTLINQTLREKINNAAVEKNSDELIEKLLNDKNALSRLKAELETV